MAAIVAGLRPSGHSDSVSKNANFLKLAAAKIEEDRQDALKESELYRKKYNDTLAYLQRLEAGYTRLGVSNGSLRAYAATNREALATLTTKVQDNNASMARLQENSQMLRSEMIRVATERNDLISAKAAHEQQATALADSLQLEKSNNLALASKASSATEKCGNLQKQLKECEEEKAKNLAQCESRIESFKTSIRTVQTSLSKALLDGTHAKAELEKAVKDHQAAHQELQTKLKESKATATQTTKDLKAEKEHTTALQARVDELATSKEELEHLVQECKKGATTMQDTLSCLAEEKAVAEAKLASVQSSLQEATERANALTVTVADLQKAQEAEKLQHAALLEKLQTDHAAALTTAQEQLTAEQRATEAAKNAAELGTEEAQKTLDEYRDQMAKELETMTQAHKAEVDTAATLRSDLESRLAESTARATASDKEVGELQVKLDGAKTGWNEREAKLEEMASALRVVHEQLANKDAELQHAAAEAEKLQENLDGLDEELQQKEVLLHNIHTASKQAAEGIAAAAGKRRVSPPVAKQQADPRPQHCVRFDDLPPTQHQSDSEEEEGFCCEETGDGDGDEEHDHTHDAVAVVVRPASTHRAPAAMLGRANGRSNARDSSRPNKAPVVQEPLSDSEDEVEINRRAFQRKRNKQSGANIMENRVSRLPAVQQQPTVTYSHRSGGVRMNAMKSRELPSSSQEALGPNAGKGVKGGEATSRFATGRREPKAKRSRFGRGGNSMGSKKQKLGAGSGSVYSLFNGVLAGEHSPSDE